MNRDHCLRPLKFTGELMLEKPYGEVTEEDLRAILDNFQKTVMNPAICITKSQLKDVCVHLLARNFLLEKRGLEAEKFNHAALINSGLVPMRLVFTVGYVENEGHTIYAKDLSGDGYSVGGWHLTDSSARSWASQNGVPITD